MTGIVRVAAAVIQRPDGQVLLAQRPPGKPYAGYWEFPGGKLEPGEAPVHALVRELREELGVDADVGPLRFHTTHDYGDRAVSLYFYESRLRGTPRPLLGQQMRWVPRAELATLGFPPADTELIRVLTESDAR